MKASTARSGLSEPFPKKETTGPVSKWFLIIHMKGILIFGLLLAWAQTRHTIPKCHNLKEQ